VTSGPSAGERDLEHLQHQLLADAEAARELRSYALAAGGEIIFT
jgi:hypothetical protein